MTPIWSVGADGEDVSARIADYLVSLTVTDRDGMESDELAVEIADPRGEIAVPRIGARLAVSLGYASTGLVEMGEFVADAVEIASPPRHISVRAHAADLREGLKKRKTRGWEATTLGAIVRTIAGEHGLTAAVGADLDGIAVPRIDQTNESDIGFLTRLGQQYGAIASIKTGRLIFARRGAGSAVSGQPITAIALRPTDVTTWRIALTETEKFTAVEARYYDVTTATETWTRAGQGGGEAVLRLRQTFPDQARAQAAADARLAALTRGEATLSLTLPGRTDMAAETPIELSGFGQELDGRWITTSATHTLGGGGYSVAVEGERGNG